MTGKRVRKQDPSQQRPLFAPYCTDCIITEVAPLKRACASHRFCKSYWMALFMGNVWPWLNHRKCGAHEKLRKLRSLPIKYAKHICLGSFQQMELLTSCSPKRTMTPWKIKRWFISAIIWFYLTTSAGMFSILCSIQGSPDTQVSNTYGEQIKYNFVSFKCPNDE